MPPKWAWSMVRASLDPAVMPTVSARCKDADISRATFYKALEKPEFVTWFKGVLLEGLLSEMSDVRQAHFRACLKEQEWAIRLWYERYGNFVPTQKHIYEDVSKLNDDQLTEIERILASGDPAGKDPPVH